MDGVNGCLLDLKAMAAAGGDESEHSSGEKQALPTHSSNFG